MMTEKLKARSTIMKRTFLIIILTIFIMTSCKNSGKLAKTSVCPDNCKAKSQTSELSCKLTTPELQKRKETVLASLKAQMTDMKELKNGYAFKFPGTEKVLDELMEFIKTERECCDFFTFKLSISGDKSETWLELTGADGAKDFISTELGL